MAPIAKTKNANASEAPRVSTEETINRNERILDSTDRGVDGHHLSAPLTRDALAIILRLSTSLTSLNQAHAGALTSLTLHGVITTATRVTSTAGAARWANIKAANPGTLTAINLNLTHALNTIL